MVDETDPGEGVLEKHAVDIAVAKQPEDIVVIQPWGTGAMTAFKMSDQDTRFEKLSATKRAESGSGPMNAGKQVL